MHPQATPDYSGCNHPPPDFDQRVSELFQNRIMQEQRDEELRPSQKQSESHSSQTDRDLQLPLPLPEHSPIEQRLPKKAANTRPAQPIAKPDKKPPIAQARPVSDFFDPKFADPASLDLYAQNMRYNRELSQLLKYIHDLEGQVTERKAQRPRQSKAKPEIILKKRENKDLEEQNRMLSRVAFELRHSAPPASPDADVRVEHLQSQIDQLRARIGSESAKRLQLKTMRAELETKLQRSRQTMLGISRKSIELQQELSAKAEPARDPSPSSQPLRPRANSNFTF